MKRSELPKWPQYQPSSSRIWIVWVLLFIAIAAFALTIVFGDAIAAKTTTVHAPYPDPRVEWVQIEVDGMRLCAPDSTHFTPPLPKGAWICVPVEVKPNFHNPKVDC